MGWTEGRDLVNRTKKVIGQFEAMLRGLFGDEQCADVLQRWAAHPGRRQRPYGRVDGRPHP
jgi:DNA-binding FrmR family transcriptional regulator